MAAECCQLHGMHEMSRAMTLGLGPGYSGYELAGKALACGMNDTGRATIAGMMNEVVIPVLACTHIDIRA